MVDLVDRCPYRKSVRGVGAAERAECHFLREITGIEDVSRCEVGRDACEYCVLSGAPSPRHINPIVASLLHALTGDIIRAGGVAGCDAAKAARLTSWAEANLDSEPAEVDRALLHERDIEHCKFLGSVLERPDESSADGSDAIVYRCHHPAHERTTLAACARCTDWTPRPGAEPVPIERMLPITGVRSGPLVRRWAIGVTTAPRRRPTLERTLDSLLRAGWDAPHLFVDGDVEIPARYARLTMTVRRPNAGEWPNFYLGLSELFQRDPDADAYMMIQDDVKFYDRANLRTYLETFLWPGNSPCPVSLYSAKLDIRAEFGWFRQKGAWYRGGLAFLFPASLIQTMLNDRVVVDHRRRRGIEGITGTDSVVGAWAYRNGTPFYAPTPSLCRHIGHASSLWFSEDEEPNREGGLFAGDVREVLEIDRSAASFPESAFRCAPLLADDYQRRVASGRERMRDQTVVICALCRDVRRQLPAMAARLEHLGSLFREFRLILFEHDSVDGTFTFLRAWSHKNPRVLLLSRRLFNSETALACGAGYPARLAALREICRENIVAQFDDFDYAIMADLDAEGGWSVDGIAHTFGDDGWDLVGSNGLLSSADGNTGEQALLPFDFSGYRRVDDDSAIGPSEFRALRFHRGEPLVRVASCFGGLGIYRMECMRRGRYEPDGDSEHVAFHRSLRAAGLGRVYLNPSQIVLYSKDDDGEIVKRIL
jgi:hypothetical protein